MVKKRQEIIEYCILIFTVITVYGRSVFNSFAYDDWFYIMGKEAYKKFDIVALFTSLPNGIEYQPIRDMTICLDYFIWGEKPGGFHFTNLLLMIMATIAVYHLAREFTLIIGKADASRDARFTFIPVITALLFAVHPINSEAVNWISGRNVIMSGLFFFLSAWSYCRHIREDKGLGRYYYLSLLFFIAALLSKATVVILPIVLLGIYLLSGNRREFKSFIPLAPFFILSAMFFYIFTQIGLSTRIIHKASFTWGLSNGLTSKIAIAVQIPFFYLKKVFIPIDLSARYNPLFENSFLSFEAIAGLVVIFSVIAVSVVQCRRSPFLALGLGWFFVVLGPVLNFFSTFPVVADRYMFIPGIGLFFLVSVLFDRCAEKLGRNLVVAVAALMLLILAVVSYNRVAVWKNNKTLWQSVIQVSPNDVDAYVGLGGEYIEEGNYDKALEFFAQAKKINPLIIAYEMGLSNLFLKKGETQSAISTLQKALIVSPESMRAHNMLGDIYFKIGDYDKALEHFVKVLESDHEEGNMISEADKKIKKIRSLRPDNLDELRRTAIGRPNDIEAQGNLALQLDRLGYFDEALSYYMKMEKLGMKDWRLFYNMANVYKKLKVYDKAAANYRRCLEQKPLFLDALNNLGLTLTELKDYRNATASFEKAMTIDKQYAYAPFNLAMAYKAMGDNQNATRYFGYTINQFPELKEKVLANMQSIKNDKK